MARLSGAVLFYFWMCLCLSATLSSGLRTERTKAKERRVAGQINCINFVFHPKCRGTAAKRAPAATKSAASSDTAESVSLDSVGESSYDTNPYKPVSSISDENGFIVDRDIAARLLESLPLSLPLSRAKIPVRTDISGSGSRADISEAVPQTDPRTHRMPDADGNWEGPPSVASRYGWVLFRKRAKEQELTYDY